MGGLSFDSDSLMGDGVEACVEGSGSFDAVLYLDLISIELPRIVCALKGAIRSICSFSNSAVDLTFGRDDVLDRNEGGPAADEIASFLTVLAGLSFAGGAIDRRWRGSASRLSLSISTAFFCCLWSLVNCEFVSLCLRALVMDTNDCFMDIEDFISDFILPVVFSTRLFSFPESTLDFVISSAFLVSGGLPKAGVVMHCLEGGRLDLCLLVALTDMSESDTRLLSSPLPSTRTFDAFKDLERFFAGFIADGGLQVGGTFRFSREVTFKEDRFRRCVEADDIGCFRVSSFLGGN